ncbi:MAG: SDR family oxidoreductase [Mycobacteriaceae bacterium]
MLIVVTGASGRTGAHVVRGLLDAGHTVRGVVRSEEKASAVRALGAQTVRGDLTAGDLGPLLTGAQALVHTAAASDPRPGRSAAVDNHATVALVAAAARTGVNRVVQVSSMYADRPEQGPEFLREVLAEKSVSDAALAGSGLAWTLLRPGGLTDDGPTGRVAVGARLPSGRISRADVAAVCVACLGESKTERRAFDLTAGAALVSEALASLED